MDVAAKQIDDYAIAIDKVMRRLEKSLLDVVGGATTATEVFDSTVLLNSQPAMLNALRESGYYALAEEHVATFALIPPETIAEFEKRNLPAPKYTKVDAQDFKSLAAMDLQQFNAIGESAMTTLRLGLVENAVSGLPFSQMVEAVRAATVGVDGKGSPLRNHAYTHANTAILNFNGEAVIKAGESVGFGEDDSAWEAVGPLDGVTRDVCVAALSNPVRTKAEWEAAGYWGGTPGGWNCRHELFPSLEEPDG